MTKKQNKMLIRILCSFVLLVAAAIVEKLLPDALPQWGWLLVFLAPYLLIGYDVLKEAVESIFHGQMLDEHFLMMVATVGALCVGELEEAVAVMLFYQVGELFQSYAVGKSRKSISALMDIRPDYANIERDGKLEQVDPEEIQVGDIIVVKAGEKVPLDGVVMEGKTTLNTAALTGESLPRDAAEGDQIISGCVNISGLIRVRVTKPFSESTVSRILELVENASNKKTRTERFITRFARIYTPAVVGAAVLLAIVPPLVLHGNWSDWIYRALTFLVVSCPCALVISVPLSFFGGIGGASSKGILVKGSNYIEALAHCETVVFDKTGTLTEGSFQVTAVHPDAVDEKELLRLAAAAESYSDHPISLSLKAACHDSIDSKLVTNVHEIAGKGVQAEFEGHTLSVGNGKLMESLGIEEHKCHKVGTIVHVAMDGKYLGHIVISDVIKPDAAKAIADLKACGVQRTVMLTGDRREVAQNVAQQLKLDDVKAELMPQGKVEAVEELLKAKSPKSTLAFVGDGINDAPVLARADLGAAMGGIGSDAAIEAADIVLMDDDPRKLSLAMRISRKTMRLVWENIVFALAVKAVCLVLGALGIANMWVAIFADVGVMVLCVLNAARALNTKHL